MLPSSLTGDLGGRAPAQIRVRPDVVVVVPPGGPARNGMRHRGEQRLVEIFVPQPAAEALDEANLHRVARCHMVPFHLALIRTSRQIFHEQCGELTPEERLSAFVPASAESLH